MSEDLPPPRPRRMPPPAWASVAIGVAIIAVTVYQLMSPPAVQEDLLRRFAVAPAFFAPGAHVFSSPVEFLAPLLGHAFLHGGWVHLGMNMLVYFQIAGVLEWRLSLRGSGGWRFIAFFAGAAAAGAIAYILINPDSTGPAVGASGAICGLFAGYLLGARPNWREAIRDPGIQRAALFFLAINVGLMWWVAEAGIFPIAWEAHLGGFIGGLALFPLLAPRIRAATGPWG